jgi:hypothetical protein
MSQRVDVIFVGLRGADVLTLPGENLAMAAGGGWRR